MSESYPPADDTVGATAAEPRGGVPVEAVLFLALGSFLVLLGVAYGLTTGRSDIGVEYAGVVALVAGGAFALFFGTYLFLMLRRIQDDVEDMEEAAAAGRRDDVLYLPTESIWPIGIGVGTSLILAGVAAGFWVMIPGIALFVHSLIGFARQSRDRALH